MKRSLVAITAGILPVLAGAQSGTSGYGPGLALDPSGGPTSGQAGSPALGRRDEIYRHSSIETCDLERSPCNVKNNTSAKRALSGSTWGEQTACQVIQALPAIGIPYNRGCPLLGSNQNPTLTATSTQTQIPIRSGSMAAPTSATIPTSATTSSTTRLSSVTTITPTSTLSNGTSTASTSSATSASSLIPPYRYAMPWQAPKNWTIYITGDIDDAYKHDEIVYFSRGIHPELNGTAPLQQILNGEIILPSNVTPLVFQSELDAYNASRLVIGQYLQDDAWGAQSVKLEQVSTSYPGPSVYWGFSFAVQSNSPPNNITAYSQDMTNLNAPWEVLIALVCGYLGPNSGVEIPQGSSLIAPGVIPDQTATQLFVARNPLGISNIVQAFNGTEGVGMLNFCTSLVGSFTAPASSS